MNCEILFTENAMSSCMVDKYCKDPTIFLNFVASSLFDSAAVLLHNSSFEVGLRLLGLTLSRKLAAYFC